MIPVVDCANSDLTTDLVEAFTTIGFATVVNHGIDTNVIEELRAMLPDLFALPDEDKQQLQITPDNYRGFIPLGFFTPNRTDHSGTAPDQYEGYKLHWECPPDEPVTHACPLYGPNRWPPQLPALRTAVEQYWEACDRLSRHLMDALAGPLGVSTTTMASWFEQPLTNMTLLRYPATSQQRTGIHPHKDTNVITLVAPAPHGGLDIQTPDGTWIEPSIPSGGPDLPLIVNVGEMLELWSGGLFRATPHRVINRTVEPRYSFPYFLVPNHSVTITPLLPANRSTEPMPVGAVTTEVWRTNWPDQRPRSTQFDLGTLGDR